MKCQILFSGKNISKCRLLKILLRVLSVKVFCSLTSLAFVHCCSNFHHTLTRRQCTCDRKIGAEKSALQELCLFVIL